MHTQNILLAGSLLAGSAAAAPFKLDSCANMESNACQSYREQQQQKQTFPTMKESEIFKRSSGETADDYWRHDNRAEFGPNQGPKLQHEALHARSFLREDKEPTFLGKVPIQEDKEPTFLQHMARSLSLLAEEAHSNKEPTFLRTDGGLFNNIGTQNLPAVQARSSIITDTAPKGDEPAGTFHIGIPESSEREPTYAEYGHDGKIGTTVSPKVHARSPLIITNTAPPGDRTVGGFHESGDKEPTFLQSHEVEPGFQLKARGVE